MAIDAAALIREHAARAGAALEKDPDGAVPWCGEWKVRDVAAHIGAGHEMTARIVEGRPTTGLEVRGELQVPDEDDESIAAWLKVASSHLLEALDGVDPATEAWSWWPDDMTVGFWARRMAHETLVHRWDAEQGAGLVPEPLDPAVAADGVDEMLDCFVGLSRILFSAPGAGETAHLHCTDTDGEWLVTFLPDGRHELRREHAKGDIAFRGPAESLLLFLWGRDGGPIETLGDEGVAARWRELVPDVMAERRIEDLVNAARRQVQPDFEARLRADLEGRDREWLVEQLVRMSLDPRSRAERDARAAAVADADARVARLERLRAIDLDEARLRAFVDGYKDHDRERLIGEARLHPEAPEPGTASINAEHRTEEGAALLQEAKDILFAVLFGDEHTDSRLVRQERELLTMVLPRHKVMAVDFLQATTEIDAEGTWKDPEAVSDDSRADNVVLEVEFGEVAGELAGQGVLVSLALINHLEVNEQILYARMTNIEQSSL